MFWSALFLYLELFNIAFSHIKECPVVMDTAFMIDVSGSIPWQDTSDVKELMTKVTSRFTVSPTGAHIALMSFADDINNLLLFKNSQNISAVHEAIGRLTHPGGGSNMAVAFSEARKLFSFANGGRKHVTRVLVVASDGNFQKHELAVESSQLVKEEGIVIITLGISSKVNKEELQMIASSKEQFLLFHDANLPAKLDLISDKITTMICEVARKPQAIVSRVKEKSALQGHLIISLQAESELLCALKCLNTLNCFSFNYKMNREICELNRTNKLTSPHDFVWDVDTVYYEMIFN